MYLASEIIKKKGRHLFITPTDEQTCVSVNLALLADPDLTMSEAISVGRSIHIRLGLSVDVKVAFNDNVRFEVVKLLSFTPRWVKVTKKPGQISNILNAYVGAGLSPFVIAQGSKIILIVDNNFQLRFIDSFSFIPIPLREFPEASGCKTQLKKGYLPHKFTDFSKNG